MKRRSITSTVEDPWNEERTREKKVKNVKRIKLRRKRRDVKRPLTLKEDEKKVKEEMLLVLPKLRDFLKSRGQAMTPMYSGYTSGPGALNFKSKSSLEVEKEKSSGA